MLPAANPTLLKITPSSNDVAVSYAFSLLSNKSASCLHEVGKEQCEGSYSKEKSTETINIACARESECKRV